MQLTAAEIAQTTAGTLLQGAAHASFDGVSIDSRTLANGNLFIPLAGAQVDGHAFIRAALDAGAAGALCNRRQAPAADALAPGQVLIAVDDTLTALGDIAACWRNRFSLPILAITGSTGKTTTKEMAATIIARQRPALKNPGNFNNLIGMPLTLLQLQATHRAAVLELGMNAPGEIDRLASICRPTVGLITTIGPVHLEFLRTVQAVCDAKAELLRHLAPDAVVILNSDDPYTAVLRPRAACRVVTFGLSDGDIRACEINRDSPWPIFTLDIRGIRQRIKLAVPGRHLIGNALAAAALADQLGIAPADIAAGLEAFAGVAGRMQLDTHAGIQILNDAYNANPVSMHAALETLAGLAGVSRRIAVVGDMLELGDEAPRYHREIGASAAALALDQLLIIGTYASDTADGAHAGGMRSEQIRTFADRDHLADYLAAQVRPGDAVLLKGSRRMGLDTLVETLRATTRSQR